MMGEPRRYGKSASQYRKAKNRYDRYESLNRTASDYDRLHRKQDVERGDYENPWREAARNFDTSDPRIREDDATAQMLIVLGLLAIPIAILYAIFST